MDIAFAIHAKLATTKIKTKQCLKPAFHYEEVTGLKGISGSWIMPPGLTEDDIKNYLKIAFISLTNDCAWNDRAILRQPEGRDFLTTRKTLQDLWHALKCLNPDLEKIQLDQNNAYKIWDSVFGVISQFNADDIDWWLNVGGTQQSREQIAGYGNMRDRIEEQLGCIMKWVVSANTMKRIHAQSALWLKTAL